MSERQRTPTRGRLRPSWHRWILGSLVVPWLLAHAGAQQTPVTPRPSAGLFGLPVDGLLGFVEIPAGPFIMGAARPGDALAFDNERWSATQPQGRVEVPTFYLAKFEVTVAQFQAFATATRAKVDPRALEAPGSHPVAFVSWPDALAYCRWIEAALKSSAATPPRLRQLFDQGWRVTLPNEAEWEKAARGTDGRIFPWGDTARRDRANFDARSAAPVGGSPCPECPFPVFDMSGNLWEWTRSPYQPYPFNLADDKANLEADALWVIRGGHFGDSAQSVRTTTRGGADPGVRRAIIGFRLAIASAQRT